MPERARNCTLFNVVKRADGWRSLYVDLLAVDIDDSPEKVWIDLDN